MACVGGGSNAAGAFYHFLDDLQVQLIAVEAAGCGINSGMSAATTQLGKPGVLHGSKSLVMQTADGQVTEPHSISAGLDYPGIGPLHAHLYESGRAKFLSATDAEALEAAFNLTRLEGIIPALESAHALAALKQMRWQPGDITVICLSGRGDKDLATYMKAMENARSNESAMAMAETIAIRKYVHVNFTGVIDCPLLFSVMFTACYLLLEIPARA
jgi:tryptophan synthase beta chain